MHRSSATRPLATFPALLLVGLLLNACSSTGPGGSAVSGSPTTAPPAATTSPSQENAPSPSTAPTAGSTADPSAEPPAATLAVEGGDPVIGQLGSFTWNGGGSDSPWLPGTQLSIGAGERLTVSLAGVAVDTWSARSAPAGSSDGADALSLGDGTVGGGGRAIAFAPPAKGRWSVQLTVRFADELGSATYYWQVSVR